MTFLDHDNNFCFVTLSSSPSTSPDSDKLHSKLEALRKVEELCEKYENVESNKNNPKNLLDNLCDGLQTFLGFDSATKGYDGKGIVYSDLDRLCDGVMGFLYAVLEAVKNDPSVTTYYKGMETTLEEIKNNIHKTGGLSAAVKAVSQALGEWDGELDKKTSALTYRLKTLNVDRFNEFDNSLKLLNSLLPEQLDQVPRHLQACITDAGAILTDFNFAEAEYEKLDETLRDKLKNAMFQIKLQVEKFHGAATNTELKAVVEVSAEKLQMLERSVHGEAERRVNTMASDINMHIHEFAKCIHVVGKTIKDYVKELHKWMTYAKEEIEATDTQVKAVIEEVKWDGTGQEAKWNKIDKAVRELEKKAQALLAAAKSAKSQIRTLVPQALEQVRKMDEELRKNIFTVRNEIKKGMMDYVRGDILTEIQERINDIKGKESTGTDSKGLDGIKLKVESYVKGFKNKFEGSIGDWVENIVDKNEGVRGFIYMYAENNKSYITGGTQAKQVSNHVKQKIISELQDISTKDKTSLTTNGSVDSNLKSIKTFLEKFQTATLQGMVDKIVGHIEGEYGLGIDIKKKDLVQRSDLQNAVRIVLRCVSTTTEQIGEEINNLADKCSLANINAALGVAASLDQEIRKALGAGSGNLKFAKKNVEAAISDMVNPKFGDDDKSNISDGSRTPDKVLLSNTFTTYKAYVNTSSLSKGDQLTGFKQKNEGTLPAAIGDIKAQVDEALKNISPGAGGDTEINEKTLNDQLTTVTNTLDKLCQAVNRIGKDVTWRLNEFKVGKIDTDLNNLKNKISEIEQCNVARLLNDGQKIKDFVNAQAKEVVHNIKIYVTSEVANAIRAIEDTAKTDYYNKINKMYNDMKTSVTHYITEVNYFIDEDKSTGIKGLVRAINGVHIKIRAGEYPKFHNSANTNLLNPIKELAKSLMLQLRGSQYLEKFTDLSGKYNAYVLNVMPYIETQLNDQTKPPTSPSPTDTTNDPANKLTKIKEHFDNLLEHLKNNTDARRIHNYDHQFTEKLASLQNAVHELSPSHFANPRHPELLDAVRQGLKGFVGEMERVYVNGYDDGQVINWDKYVIFSGYQVTPKKEGTASYKITPDGIKLAKIFFTILNMLQENIRRLHFKCEHDWKNEKICRDKKDRENPLGQYLMRCGYDVAENEDSKDGETQCKTSRTGKHIYDKLNEKIKDADNNPHLKICKLGDRTDKFNVTHILDCLLGHLETYNDVGHLSSLTSKRNPCSVYEMLVWLSGLTHTPVHKGTLDVTILEAIADINKDENEEETSDFLEPVLTVEMGDSPTFSWAQEKEMSLDAYPKKVSYANIREAITQVCANAYDILCTVAGTGNELTTYGSDFSNNAMKLYYPPSGDDCLDMLLDILRRLFPTLQFLRTQCTYRSTHSGWRDCMYGKDIPSGKSHCTDHPRDKAKCEPNCQANCKATCQVNCQPNCQPNSPLMSYLNDCLPGHLPHQLTKIGCKYECAACPSTSKKGMPCLTPLGFRGFSGSTKTGKDICDILDAFFNACDLRTLFALRPKPPSNLAEHFSFALSIASGIRDSNTMKKSTETFAATFRNSIAGVSIKLYDESSNFINAVTYAYGSDSSNHEDCDNNHVKNLTQRGICKNDKNVDCAPYLRSLRTDSYVYLLNKQTDTYLSWAVYLPWTFWDLLNNLYNDFCNIFCQDWGCHTCLQGNKCKRGQHGHSDENTKKPHCQCTSMVRCRGVFPTLYKYGFHFGAPATLNSASKPKTCSNFHDQLYHTLHSKYFSDLFEKCDEFLWIIRQPFSYLVLALWLLSLLYLIHIMVIRLDLLHIKSHLHSPSSHRIAAQSLLAAGRVNKLNKVFYLQP